MKYNPFNPNSVVSTNLFAGRTSYTLKILKKLEQVRHGMPSSFFLYGERGIGKTALAKLIKDVAEIQDPKLGNLNFLTSYYSAEKDQSIGSILQSSLNELTDNMPQSAVDYLGSKLGNLFKNGKFSIGPFSLEFQTKNKEDQNIVLRDQLISILTTTLNAIGKVNGREVTRDGVVIIIDEFDNVADMELCAQLFRGIITTLDVKKAGFISFLLIGYDFTLARFFEGDPSARRQFDSIPLGVMPLEEACEVLTKGFKEAQVQWDEDVLKRNVFVTAGYPHMIQYVGHALLENDKDNFIGANDWKVAHEQAALELPTKDFADMYNFGGKPKMKEKILDILAVAGRPMAKADITKYCDGKNIYQYLGDLRKKGSIKQLSESEDIMLHSQLFRTSILFKIMPRIQNDGYLKELIEKEMKPNGQ